MWHTVDGWNERRSKQDIVRINQEDSARGVGSWKAGCCNVSAHAGCKSRFAKLSDLHTPLLIAKRSRKGLHVCTSAVFSNDLTGEFFVDPTAMSSVSKLKGAFISDAKHSAGHPRDDVLLILFLILIFVLLVIIVILGVADLLTELFESFLLFVRTTSLKSWWCKVTYLVHAPLLFEVTQDNQ